MCFAVIPASRPQSLRRAVLAAALLVAGCGCLSDPEPPSRGPRPGPVPTLPSVPPDPTGPAGPGPDPGPAAATRPSPRRRTDPALLERLQDLEADYLALKFAWVIGEAEPMLAQAEGDPQLQLDLFYLLARAHARNGNPTEANRYERLFKDLLDSLRKGSPRDEDEAAAAKAVLDRSEEIFQEVHPAWDADRDGGVWVNVRLHRLLSRQPPDAVLTEKHPDGALIHASMNLKALEDELTLKGLLRPDQPVQRDQRFGFYFWIQEIP